MTGYTFLIPQKDKVLNVIRDALIELNGINERGKEFNHKTVIRKYQL